MRLFCARKHSLNMSILGSVLQYYCNIYSPGIQCRPTCSCAYASMQELQLVEPATANNSAHNFS